MFKHLVLKGYSTDFKVCWCKMKVKSCLFRFWTLPFPVFTWGGRKLRVKQKTTIFPSIFSQCALILNPRWWHTGPWKTAKCHIYTNAPPWKLLGYLSYWRPQIFNPNGTDYDVIGRGKKFRLRNQEWECLPLEPPPGYIRPRTRAYRNELWSHWNFYGKIC